MNTRICLVKPRMETQNAEDGEEVRKHFFEERCLILSLNERALLLADRVGTSWSDPNPWKVSLEGVEER